MKLISSNRVLATTLKRLIKQHTEIHFAVAWVTENEVFDVLCQHESKIRRAVIGTHFYQTDPLVLERFYKHANVRFVMQTGGVFHPKLFLFNTGNKWEVLVGSANLTRGALNRNYEVMLHIKSDSDMTETLYGDAGGLIETYWNDAKAISDKEVQGYRLLCEQKRKLIQRLDGSYGGSSKESKPMTESSVLSLPWDRYYLRLQEDDQHIFYERVQLLKRVADAFADIQRYQEMPTAMRRTIAGLPNDEEPNAGWFGSMRGNGCFFQSVNQNNRHLSAALDAIPQRGLVTRSQYDSYVDRFRQAVPAAHFGVSVASRLLAMKRPDQFVCLSGRNLKGLCKDFGVVPRGMDCDRYWEEIIERIQDAPWWNSNCPAAPDEADVWRGRVALLDSIFYE